MTDLTPTIFFGYGNPMNALSKNVFTDGWVSIGKSIQRPEAILAVSAHWYVPVCAVTANLAPRTIHDFEGFPEERYHVEYLASGNQDLARHIKDLLAPVPVGFDESWGLDHGTWSVLRHVFPKCRYPCRSTQHQSNAAAALSS